MSEPKRKKQKRFMSGKVQEIDWRTLGPYKGDASVWQWIGYHTMAKANAREASSELWNAFQIMAPAAAAKGSRASFGRELAAKYGKAKYARVTRNGKVTKWFSGFRLLPCGYLNKKAIGYKFQFEWEQRYVGKPPSSSMSSSRRKMLKALRLKSEAEPQKPAA